MKGPYGWQYLSIKRLRELLSVLGDNVLAIPSSGDLSLYTKNGSYIGTLRFKGKGDLVNTPE